MCDYAYGALEIAKQRPDKDIFWYDESMAREQEAEAKAYARDMQCNG